jgi:outer membrane protein TolC
MATTPRNRPFNSVVLKLRITALAPALALALSSCATYAPRPLSQQADLAGRIPMTVPVKALAVPLPDYHRFDPSDGLDMTEVAMLAAVNNPGLRVQRSKAALARAQLFAAGLLPDPQISVSTDHPTSGPATTDAYGLGLNYGLTALITRGAGIDAARATAEQVNLEVLWQEWQVVQKARLLFVQMATQVRKLTLLREMQSLYAERYSQSAKALREGNVTLDVTGTDLTALLDADSRVNQLERDLNKTHHELNGLLGLAPGLALDLSPLRPPPTPADTTDVEVLKTLPKRRPDLLALQAGYRSQEARVRRAILAQFPSLNVGITRARDTSDVHTIGLGITVDLPVFNANRGKIAVQRATRQQLHQEYQLRLDQAHIQIDLLERQQRLVQQLLQQDDAKLPELTRMVNLAQRAYREGNIGALTFLNMQNTLVSKQLEKLDLGQALWDTHIGIETLLGWSGSEYQAPSTN